MDMSIPSDVPMPDFGQSTVIVNSEIYVSNPSFHARLVGENIEYNVRKARRLSRRQFVQLLRDKGFLHFYGFEMTTTFLTYIEWGEFTDVFMDEVFEEIQNTLIKRNKEVL